MVEAFVIRKQLDRLSIPCQFSLDNPTKKPLAKALPCIYNIIMAQLKFEWDPDKAEANRIKHKIAFEEAVSVFSDENALIIPDPDHSDDEEPFVLLGMSWSLRILVVCHCYRKNDQIIRIFSARKATKAEGKQYGPKP